MASAAASGGSVAADGAASPLPMKLIVEPMADMTLTYAKKVEDLEAMLRETGRPATPAESRVLKEAQTKSNMSFWDSAVLLNPDDFREAGLFAGDRVLIKGKKRRETVLSPVADATVPRGSAGLTQGQRKNLAVRTTGDFVRMDAMPGGEPRDLVKITVAPIKETLEHVTGDIGNAFLKPFFKLVPRVLRQGDLFSFSAGNRQVWFKVCEVERPGKLDFGLVRVPDGRARPAPAPGAPPAGAMPGAVPGEDLGPPPTTIVLAAPLAQEEGERELNAIGYDDIGGLTEQLATIREIVELPLRHPQLFETMGVRPPKGVLMHGPPGTGKTLIARAIANETGVEMITVNGPAVLSGGADGGAIRNLFSQARKTSEEKGGCIVFIDELDALAPNRDKVRDQNMKSVVTALLTEMDGMESGAHVIVIGATNRPNVIDPAVRRAGRFDTELIIPTPSREARYEILQKITRKMKLGSTVDLRHLAEITHGYVGADLSALCMKAAVNCVRAALTGERGSDDDDGKKKSGDDEEDDDDDKVKSVLLDVDDEDLPAEFLASISIQLADFLKAMDMITASAMREVAIEKPSTRFADIGGLEEVKKAMRDIVETPVKHPDKFRAMGLTPPAGALMYGPPGCGKTLIAKAMANECGVNFISIKGPQLMTKWFGESEENIRDIFNKARQAAPAILFFDELDSIARTRGGWGASSAGGVHDRVVNQLLTELDGIVERKSVFVIGATNLPDAIDPALRRPGRLDQLIYVPMPDREARRGVFKAVLRKTVVARTVDVEALSDACEGFSGSDIAGLCQMAIKIGARDRLSAIFAAKDKALEEGRIAAERVDDPRDKKRLLSQKRALARAKEMTKNWALTAEVFQRARAASKRSVTEESLRGYLQSKERLEAKTGGAAASAAAASIREGSFSVRPVAAAASAAAAAADIDDDEMYA